MKGEGRSEMFVVLFKRAGFAIRHDEMGPPALDRFTPAEAAHYIGMVEGFRHFDFLQKAHLALFPRVI
jgi:hypothetical protein